MIERDIEAKTLYFSKKYPVVTITGPRQSGKTTLVEKLFSDYEYFTLENPLTRAQIKEDPSVLFYPKGKKVIIDEVQRLPDLLSHIQVEADQQKINGQFIITSSQSLLLSEKVSQTLAGRTAILKLLPFSLSELQALEKFSGDHYTNWLFRGFYPRIYDQEMQPADFYPFYYETYLQRDVREIQNVRDLTLFSNFVKLCAGRVGQLVDYTSLANDAGVSVNTARGWLSVLEASFVIVLLHPWYKNLGKRIIKSPKLYFVDVGLASFLLNIHDAEQLTNHYLKGNLFENLILLELLKHRFNQGQLSNLHFFRDSNKNEVDCIIEELDIKAVEIKSAMTFSNSFIEGLETFVKSSEIDRMNGYVVYGGDKMFMFKGFQVISWRNLGRIVKLTTI
jgi:uncharacterized protein